MRKISGVNKINFLIFGVITSLIIVLLFIFIINFNKNEVENLSIPQGIVAYDKNNNYFKTTEIGEVKKLWTTDYLLTEGKKSYDLGKTSVLFDESTKTLTTLGKLYKVTKDSSVEISNGINELVKDGELNFYKLADRKYLIVSDEITIEEDGAKINNYIVVDIDKSGTAQIFNNELNYKVMNPMVINFDEFKFDVAKEVVFHDDEIIDLAKIGGTTNEFLALEAESEKNIADSTDNKNDNTNDTGTTNTNNTNNTNNTTNNNSSNINSNNIVVNNGNGSGSNIENNSSNNNSDNSNSNNGNSNNGNSNNSTNQNKAIGKIDTVNSGVTDITVNYTINDYDSKYSTYVLSVKDEKGTVMNSFINKEYKVKGIYNLIPASKYEVTLTGILSKVENGEEVNEEVFLDNLIVSTKEMKSDINIVRISKSKIDFKINFRDNIIISKADIALYSEDQLIGRKSIDVSKAITENGATGYFEIEDTENYKEFTLKLENVEYDGVAIETTSEKTFENNFYINTLRMFKNILGL